MEIEINQQYTNYNLTKFNLILTKFSFETKKLIDALLLAQKNIFHPIILNNI